jgi:hypothetical protein
MLSEVFFSLLLTSLIGLILALARICYKSKCKVIKCCGLEIDRNIEMEEKIDEIQINNSNKDLNDESKI